MPQVAAWNNLLSSPAAKPRHCPKQAAARQTPWCTSSPQSLASCAHGHALSPELCKQDSDFGHQAVRSVQAGASIGFSLWNLAGVRMDFKIGERVWIMSAHSERHAQLLGEELLHGRLAQVHAHASAAALCQVPAAVAHRN